MTKKEDDDDDDKKDRAPRQPRPKVTPPEKPAPSGWDLKPQKPVSVDDVPIDALRGIHYFLIERADKKLSKAELKRTLHELLTNKDKQDKLVQNIVNVVFS